MSFLRRTTKTIGAIAIAGGATLFAAGPASAEGPGLPGNPKCIDIEGSGGAACIDWYDTQEQCEDAKQWALDNGAAYAVCANAFGGSYPLGTTWNDSMAPRV
ncbi:hypothetical protein EK0264_09670 [Epidermidibacterium keratini]|uniref:DUF3551 domain-containing protein n=1 Tax=Epidermidibacterium keratini TaxID=1891644 RepID=A0A7L4YMM6_9ACTN|nr:hypothetical protein [Epidermidibacterium keratini]QHC00525.1 hypothetical protein EK0264_09670 [Epidermidibacterium keratini]